MVGYIQIVLFDLILANSDEATLNRIKNKADVAPDKEFRMDTVYSDEEWQRLLQATLEEFGITAAQAYEMYAQQFFKDSLKRFPMWFEISKDSYDFLSRQPAIHNNFATAVRDKQERDSIIDKFHLEKLDRKIIMHYRSVNKHCGLYIALAKVIINCYNDKASVVEKKCLLNDDHECEIHIDWE